jgi:hypothetical protein
MSDSIEVNSKVSFFEIVVLASNTPTKGVDNAKKH